MTLHGRPDDLVLRAALHAPVTVAATVTGPSRDRHGFFARDGWTRFGSPGIFGKFGG